MKTKFGIGIRPLIGTVLLVLLGLVQMPLEFRLSDSLREKKLIPSPPDLSLRESLGQMGFAAVLGGLRSLIASITYLQAYVAFENIEWGKVDSLMTLTTRLQPQEPLYWDDASWHMAYNAASSYQKDESLRLPLRDKLYRDYVQRGIDILNEGLTYLPDNPRLLTRLGDIYNANSASRRQPDARKAAHYYLEAYKNGAREFYERMAAYQLALLDDRESQQQAYDILRRYYDKGRYFDTMNTLFPELEEKLGIPKEKRVPGPVKFQSR